ncbi:LOW QUALITY PROTEIN: uncharacterized protein LOC117677004 [Pantherophis guttatus]|uniref:LOW QUALITY PROTEIN: uncharacterized protein LOC117677004 n=1 Tax=Pantherophis guttatus TaxID=94885 RepID=A0A6P9D958_PANGU|nr:LOW QUALITY PROTEIN: uncharacterized protein LOC117677004 [Pantherophis guttatus]
MGKFLLTCSIVILFILLQTEEIVSISKKGSSRPSGSSSRKPTGSSKPSHNPSKPSHRPSKLSRSPFKPVVRPRKPIPKLPENRHALPKRPDNPAKLPPNHAVPPPPYNPAHPPHNPAIPKNPGYLPPYPVNPQNPAHPPNNPVNPGNPPPYNPAYPYPVNPQNPARPPNNPVNPGNPPPYNPAYPYPVNPQNPAHPQIILLTQGILLHITLPTHIRSTLKTPHVPHRIRSTLKTQHPLHRIQSTPKPRTSPTVSVNPQNPAHPPPYPVNPQKPAHPPPYRSTPKPAHPPPYPVNPQNPARPPPYPVNPQNPAHPPPYPVNPQNPAHPPPYPVKPQNPGYFPHQPYNPQNPHWGHYNPKPWKPKPPKTNMKHVAGAAIAGAAAGAVGGYFLGRAMSNLHFQFNNMNEERWWYENRHRYSDKVYYPQYIQPVPQDIFVRDCVNITVKEYIEPTGNATEDEMEARVVKHVVKEMCIEQYRTFSRSAEGGSSKPHDGNPVDPKSKDDEVKYVVGEPVVDAPVEDPESYILGSPIAKMYFPFNDSEEERWWNENRHRFATHVYHPNSSQPISRDVFLSECVNVTVRGYVKPTGNQTEDELEARVVTQVANEKCMEMYPRLTVITMAGSYYNNKPETATTLEIKSEFKHGEGAALANSPGEASGHNAPKNAVSDLHFSFENALFLIHPFAISVITLITPFLIF